MDSRLRGSDIVVDSDIVGRDPYDPAGRKPMAPDNVSLTPGPSPGRRGEYIWSQVPHVFRRGNLHDNNPAAD